jgi:SAM-dependent methyltransferase
MESTTRDRWAEWLAERRFGGDPELRAATLERLARTRDAVLDRAELREGETLLDVGCGEGLIGFGALERGAGSVVFSDISPDLLDFCRETATEIGVLDRCSFVEAPADDLASIPDGSADVVTARSALIFVEEKRAALAEFARVLRPGGRISLWEAARDLRRDPGSGPRPDARLRRARPAPARGSGGILAHPADARRPHRVGRAAEAGRVPRHRLEPEGADLAEAMEEALTPEEGERFAAQLRPLVERGEGQWRMAVAHLSAVRP